MQAKICDIVIFCLLSSIISNSFNVGKLIIDSTSKLPNKERFKIFHYIFAKPYSLNSDEGLIKYRIFKQNLKIIDDINSKSTDFKVGVNQFADLTLEEYTKGYLSVIPEEDYQIQPQSSEVDIYDSENDLTDENDENFTVSWAEHLSEVKDQGSCASCWSYSTISAIETDYSINFNKKINFSPQDLIDCNSNNLGCIRGSTARAFQFIVDRGIAYLKDYPDTSFKSGMSGNCKQDVIRVKPLVAFERGSDRSQFNNLIKRGAVQVNLDSSSNEFKFYKEGDFKTLCKVKNHGGLAYEKGKDYILVLNSWGTKWGIDGAIKLKINSADQTCLTETYSILPIVAKVHKD